MKSKFIFIVLFFSIGLFSSTSGISKGIYFVKLNSEKYTEVARLVIE